MFCRQFTAVCFFICPKKGQKKRGHHLNGQKGMERIACTELNSVQNIQVVIKIYYNFNKKASDI